MQLKCDYCGQFLLDSDPVCPNCGAPNDQAQRSGSGVPKTIGELKAFCAARNLPLEKMRFFLGEDYQGPRAFGIFQDGDGDFVVYKNKSDGVRAIRYRGKDEAYAVNEIYQKLKSEILNQRQQNAARSVSRGGGGSRRRKTPPQRIFLIIAMIMLALIVINALSSRSPNRGYYRYQGDYYYYQNDNWYQYDDDLLDWVPAVVGQELIDNYGDYYESYSYSGDYSVDDFSDSGYYQTSSDWDDGWSSDWDSDDDWDWGSDDWDSGWSDWDSDW